MAGIDTYTKLMLHCDGADTSTTFTDDSGQSHVTTATGGAQLDTAQKKFGSASGYLDGDGDYLSVEDSDDWNFGTGDLTVDFWWRPDTLSNGSYYTIWSQSIDQSNRIHAFYLHGTGIYWYVAVGGAPYFYLDDAACTLVADQWQHIAYVRYGTSFRIYVDGVIKGNRTFTSITMPDLATPLKIGANNSAFWSYANGWFDEIRVSKGIARWTADFSSSLPTEAYSSDSGVIYTPSTISLLGVGK